MLSMKRIARACPFERLSAKPYRRVAEVAVFLDVFPQLIYTLIRRGEIPVCKAGRRSRIPRDKFMKTLERRLVFSNQIFKTTSVKHADFAH
jgi:excisionase family DNA binding protein